MKNTEKHFFRSNRFFSKEFPFCITKMKHTAEDYNESMSCQREFWKIIYIISGNGQKIINKRKYSMSAGNLFLIHPDDHTTFVIESENIEIYNILFMPDLINTEIEKLKSDFGFFQIFGKDFHTNPDHRKMLYILDSNREIESLIKKIAKEYSRELPNYQNMICLYLQELLINISRISSQKASKNKQKNVIMYIEHMIREHYDEDFELDKLAQQVGITKNHLCKIFKKDKGFTIMEFLLETRLQQAEILLKSTQLTASEICYRCGFNNLSYFYRAFADKHQLSPIQFRKKFTLY